MIENMINNSLMNTVKNQLKNINILLNAVNEHIKKNNTKLENIINNISYIKNNNNNSNNNNKNIIQAILDIKVNESIILFNIDDINNNGIDVYLNNQKINMINNKGRWKIDYLFENDGKYIFDIVFNDTISNLKEFFEKCSNIISLDFSKFNSSNVTDMSYLFNECSKLKEIKGFNKINTKNVENMSVMFQKC